MEWQFTLAYLGAVLAILLIAAGVLYLICYFTSPRGEDSSIRRDTQPKEVKQNKDNRGKLLAAGGQTMVSALQKSASDSDVVIATAISSIPLRELGGKNNDIVVDVMQKMYLDKDLKGHDEHQCIVCNTHKDIAWNQVSCYAQTTIGVLVYKRTVAADQKRTATPKSNSAWNCLIPRSQPKQLQQPQDLSTAPYNERSRSVSTTTLAPVPDSRLSVKSSPKSPKTHAKSPKPSSR